MTEVKEAIQILGFAEKKIHNEQALAEVRTAQRILRRFCERTTRWEGTIPDPLDPTKPLTTARG